MKATIPYIKVDIPVWVVFRALGVISDHDILEHICYDSQDKDTQMLEMLKPCIDDGFVIQDREVSRRGPIFESYLTHARLPWITSEIEAPLRAWFEKSVCVTPRRFFKRRCYLTFLCRKALNRRKRTFSDI